MPEQPEAPPSAQNTPSWLPRLWHTSKRWYYDGPAVFNYPGRKILGYRSPTLMAWIWLKSWALTWFTPAGRIMIIVTILVSMVGLLSDLMPVYYLSFLLLALFVVDFAFGRWYRPRLELTRRVPHTATVGVPFTVRYRVRAAGGKRPAWNVFIDTVPLPVHLRFLDRGIQLAGLPSEELELQRQLVATRRGRYHLPLAVADSAFPFGIWRAGTRAAPNRPIVVLPAYRPLSAMPLPRRSGAAHGGDSQSGSRGDSLNFLSCREYRYGDNPRHVHAAAWARLGRPVVKEFSDERALRLAVVVDLRVPPPSLASYLEQELLGKPNQRFEALCCMTAAIADWIHREGGNMQLYLPGWQPSSVIPNASDGLREILTVLAGLDPLPNTQKLAFADALKAELASLAGVVMVSALPDASWQAAVRELGDDGGTYAVAIDSKAIKLPFANACAVRTRDVLAGTVDRLD